MRKGNQILTSVNGVNRGRKDVLFWIRNERGRRWEKIVLIIMMIGWLIRIVLRLLLMIRKKLWWRMVVMMMWKGRKWELILRRNRELIIRLPFNPLPRIS